MPRLLQISPGEPQVPVATDEELLDFANAVRVAGGANVLEALLPSEPSNPKSCLIANALNFSCSVMPSSKPHPDCPHGVSGLWFMHLPENTDRERAESIAASVDCALRVRHSYVDGEEVYSLALPLHIGNAAAAFDTGRAFTNYRSFGGAIPSNA